MSFKPEDVQANREYFARKLRAEKQRNDVLKAVEAGTLDFVLLDTRGAEAFAGGHIPGAWCMTASPEDVDRVARLLPRDREVVTYCWGHD
jgi:rhodanese-related sulfurtransferase